MNRAQRRKQQNGQKNNFSSEKVVRGASIMSKFATREPDFSGVPLATMCQSIQLLINELYNRGYPVYDFDNKDKYVQGIQIIKDKVYFLAAKEDDAIEKV